MSDSIRELQTEIKVWADSVFPDRTAFNCLCKLMMEEIPELALDPSDPYEFADVVIMVLDLATLKGIDVADAVRQKMEINRRRTWARDPETGMMSHEPVVSAVWGKE